MSASEALCRTSALRIPSGRLVALVGPNGAGKSTFLNLVVGLTAPTTGRLSVLDGVPAGSPAALDGIAFVAQDMPLYRQLSVKDMVHMTRNLNRGFDVAMAERRLSDLGVGMRRRVAGLSGGQQAQLALTLALARHPRLLVLDEPTAPLDPLARHDFMATVMAAMAEDGLSAVLSSHALAELERVADYLLLIRRGVVRLDGPIDQLTAQHALMTGPADEAPDPGWTVIETIAAGTQQHLLVRLPDQERRELPRWEGRPVGVEELALAYLREASSSARPVLVGVR